jgi:hypothetical protein
MTLLFVKKNYFVPGTYQWIKPPTAAGAGPGGSTYLQSIVTVIGGGSGGGSGEANNGQATGGPGGNGGAGGAYAQATYLPAALLAFEPIVVGAGTPGGAAQQVPGIGLQAATGLNSLTAAGSNFGAHITCGGGNTSGNQIGATAPSVVGGSNIIANRGAFGVASGNGVRDQPELGVSFPINSSFVTAFANSPNSGGAPGGCTSSVTGVFIGNNAGFLFPAARGAQGLTNSTSVAPSGLVIGPFSNGGAGSGAGVPGIFPITAGNGAPAPPNSGAGGGGGGAATNLANAGGGLITSGAGGKGSDGAVQVVDIYTLPPTPPTYIFNLEIIAWYHMFNMARPISLTGRYKS